MKNKQTWEKGHRPQLNSELRGMIRNRVLLARDGFMSRCVDPVPTGCRPHLVCELLPVPLVASSQWDHGDGTSRALRAWSCVREITHDSQTGRAVEDGLWRHLQSLIHPVTGLACVPEYSHLPAGPHYYHTWDQGRLFDYLVLRWSQLAESAAEKSALLARIRRLQHTLTSLSSSRRQEDGNLARWWPAEVYYDAEPQPATGTCGPHDFRDWCIGASQFLPPQVRLAALTGDPADLDLALEIARGFLAGYERRRGSSAPMFAANGKFYGHFHGAVSGLDGVLQLASLLYRRGETVLGGQWIELAIRVYRWIFDPALNTNAGSRCGCCSETAQDVPHQTSEMCCTADMIEFAAHLAECATLHPRWAMLADLWDDVERFTRNEVFKTQVTDLDRIAKHVVLPPGVSSEQAQAMLRRQLGSWVFGRPFLHDLVHWQSAAAIPGLPWIAAAGGASGPSPVVPVLQGAGCCAYSGLRALHVAWKKAIGADPASVEVRIPAAYDDETVAIEPLPAEMGMQIQARTARSVRLRLPLGVEKDSVRVESGKATAHWSADRRWITFVLAAGQAATVSWQPRDWTVAETFGPFNELGVVPHVGRHERVSCTSHYRGNDLIATEPAGATFPYAQGL